MKVWDRKYQCWMFAPFSTDGINGGDRFVAKGGKGYSSKEIKENELLEQDEWLPSEAERQGKRFVIHE